MSEKRSLPVEPARLSLSKKGLHFLRDEGVLSEYPASSLPALERRAQVSDLTLRHELAVMDVKVAFHRAVATAPAYALAEFSTWPALNQFKAIRPGLVEQEVIVKPDAFVRIHEHEADGGLSEHTFFFEVDRSTETQDVLVNRAACYVSYFKSGGFAVRNGASREEFKDYPFRVLMAFKSTERRNNVAERLLKQIPPIFTQVYLSTFEEIGADPLGAVWVRPIDYRTATRGTAFDPEKRGHQTGYQRQTAREVYVEAHVEKCRLLTDEPAP